jgi:hypothetical protein
VADHSRYRLENGEPTVDIRIARIEHLFDNRDPAPFRDRDLDPDVVEYVVGAAEDLAAHPGARIVFWLDKPCQPIEIERAFRAHFEYELERIDRTRRRNRRAGQLALIAAAVLVVALVSLAQLVGNLVHSSIGAGLKEGLMISCWVLMWRPVEILVYDWIPWRRQRRVLHKLIAMPIDVRSGKGPT